MIEVGSRVKVKDNYTGPTELHGMEGTVVRSSLSFDWRVQLDGEQGTDMFFTKELELVS